MLIQNRYRLFLPHRRAHTHEAPRIKAHCSRSAHKRDEQDQIIFSFGCHCKSDILFAFITTTTITTTKNILILDAWLQQRRETSFCIDALNHFCDENLHLVFPFDCTLFADFIRNRSYNTLWIHHRYRIWRPCERDFRTRCNSNEWFYPARFFVNKLRGARGRACKPNHYAKHPENFT